MRLRVAGLTWPEIARDLDLALSTIYEAVQQETARAREEIAETSRDLVDLQQQRLDNVIAHANARLLKFGNGKDSAGAHTISALRVIIAAEERRAKLLGLDAPSKQEISIVADEARAEADTVMAELIEELELTPEQRSRAAAFFERRAERMRTLSRARATAAGIAVDDEEGAGE